jgi:hypothetical protein
MTDTTIGLLIAALGLILLFWNSHFGPRLGGCLIGLLAWAMMAVGLLIAVYETLPEANTP